MGGTGQFWLIDVYPDELLHCSLACTRDQIAFWPESGHSGRTKLQAL
jgi:hypothetical protein